LEFFFTNTQRAPGVVKETKNEYPAASSPSDKGGSALWKRNYQTPSFRRAGEVRFTTHHHTTHPDPAASSPTDKGGSALWKRNYQTPSFRRAGEVRFTTHHPATHPDPAASSPSDKGGSD
jgi:hypothetical protein